MLIESIVNSHDRPLLPKLCKQVRPPQWTENPIVSPYYCTAELPGAILPVWDRLALMQTGTWSEWDTDCCKTYWRHPPPGSLNLKFHRNYNFENKYFKNTEATSIFLFKNINRFWSLITVSLLLNVLSLCHSYNVMLQ